MAATFIKHMLQSTQNLINIKIDIRSSLSFILLSIIAVSVVIFLLTKIDDATREIDSLSNTPVYKELHQETGEAKAPRVLPR